MELGERRALDRRAFAARYGGPPTTWVRAPGRVDLMGSHTDYNEGYVLTMTVDRDTWLAVRPRTDGRVAVASLDLPGVAEFELDAIGHDPPSPWTDYVRGVASVLARRGPGAGRLRRAASRARCPSAAASRRRPPSRSLRCWPSRRSAASTWSRSRWPSWASARRTSSWASTAGSSTSTPRRSGRPATPCCSTAGTWRADPSPSRRTWQSSSATLARRAAAGGHRIRRATCPVRGWRRPPAGHRPDGQRPARRQPGPAGRPRGGAAAGVARRCRFIVEEDRRVLDLAEALPSGDPAILAGLLDASYAGADDALRDRRPGHDRHARGHGGAPGLIARRQAGAGFGGCLVAFVERGAVEAFAAHVERALCGCHRHRAARLRRGGRTRRWHHRPRRLRPRSGSRPVSAGPSPPPRSASGRPLTWASS